MERANQKNLLGLLIFIGLLLTVQFLHVGLDCKTVAFFLKISKKSVKSGIRVLRPQGVWDEMYF